MNLKSLSFLTIILTFILVNLGGYVHNTGSSLACPDWPLCFGQVFPRMEGGILIEHSHRLLASVVGFLTILLVFFSYKNLKGSEHAKTRKFSVYLLLMVIMQGVLGGLTVIYRLPTLVSTSHLGLSMIYFCSLIYFHHLVSPRDVVRKSKTKSRFELLLAALLVYLQMLIGALMRHLGVGAACGVGYKHSFKCFDINNWGAGWIPTSPQAMLNATHRYFAIIVALTLFVVCIRFLKKSFSHNALSKKWFVIPMVVVVAQVLLGVMTIGTHLGELTTTLHLGGAALLLAFTWKAFLEMGEIEDGGSQFISDLFSLTKPRLSMMVVFTSTLGLCLAPGSISLKTAIISVLSTALVVAGACSLNCYLEVDVDGKMDRTSDRPLPNQRMNPNIALLMGILFVSIFNGLLYHYVNSITALLGIIATLIYVVIYTPLKKKSPTALYVGAIPGAIPPLMGWTSVTGSIDWPGLSLFLILFFWQIPHFLSITFFRLEDYRAAGIKVFPLVRGIKKAKMNLFLTTIFLVGFSLLPLLLGVAETGSAYIIVVLGAAFIALAARGFQLGESGEEFVKWSRTYFYGSLVYLPGVLTALVAF